MWYFTDLANWFDKNKHETDTFTTFGSGFVDLLRIGDGIKEGGLKGWGKDSLRFVAVFPVGKAANTIKTLRGTAAAKLIANIGGPNCFWVPTTRGNCRRYV